MSTITMIAHINNLIDMGKKYPKSLMLEEQIILTIPIRSIYFIDVPDTLSDVRRDFV